MWSDDWLTACRCSPKRNVFGFAELGHTQSGVRGVLTVVGVFIAEGAHNNDSGSEQVKSHTIHV